MKKLLVLFVCLFLLVGCKNDQTGKEPGNGGSGGNTTTAKQLLEQKLIDYGKKIYESDTWTKGGIEPLTYYTTLEEMKTVFGFDISMFVNETTQKPCDADKTRIEFVVTSEKKAAQTTYTLKPVLYCE